MSAIEVDVPPPYSTLPEPLTGALRELARVSTVLIALDFDGTLAPEVDDPAAARALPEAREAVLRLTGMRRTRVALVSGRALTSLEAVAQLPDGVLLVGSHGAEIRLDAGATAIPLRAGELDDLDTLREVLDGVAADLDDVWVEPKPVGFALHTRLATEADSRIAHLEALQQVRAALDGGGVHVREGKNVLEFSIRSTTKGEAIEHLRRYTGADAVFYAGDDVTDEDAFEALGPDDLGLKSGQGPTLAAFRVPGPAEVALVLARLADFREGDVHEQ